MSDFRLTQLLNGKRGTKRPIKTGGGTLLAKDSGAYCVFNATTVTTYTLPACEEGLEFEFFCAATAAGTLDIFRIVCATGDFMLGTFIQSTDSTYTSAARAADGAADLAWEGNGSTTGGLAGDWVRVRGLNSTQWSVYGMGRATGSEGSPFKTS